MIIKHFSLYGNCYSFKIDLRQSIIFFILFTVFLGLAVNEWKKVEPKNTDSVFIKNINKNQAQLKLTGFWLNNSFLLDNQTYQGKRGYSHLGLFQPLNSQQVLLINLGWLKAPALRSEIPNVPLPKGKQNIVTTSTPMIKPDSWSTDHWPSPIGKQWPKRIHHIDIERFELATQTKIETGYWKLLSGKGKLIDVFQPTVYNNKHQSNSLQWLMIAFSALVIGIWGNIQKVSYNKSSHPKK